MPPIARIKAVNAPGESVSIMPGRVAKKMISASETAAINCTSELARPLVEATFTPSRRVCSDTSAKRADS